jgi:hypothetical protein
MRLVDTMLLRRKRILHRRSRYSTPSIEFPKQTTHNSAQSRRIDMHSTLQLDDPGLDSGAVGSTVQKAPKSQAATATTLAADGLRKVSSPSVASMARTVALADHEELVFPSPPVGYKRLRNEQMRELPQGDDNNPIAMTKLDEKVWTSLQHNEMNVEVICPFCFFALSSLDVEDEKKWRSVFASLQNGLRKMMS